MVTKNFEKFILDGTRSNFNFSNMVTIISNCLNSWNDVPLKWKSSEEYKQFHENIARFGIDGIVNEEISFKKRAESILDWVVAQSKPSIPMAAITHKVIHALLSSQPDVG